ncbi:peroxide stress protein YaaA [Herbaspirillum sp. AP02]|uniref:peroxide stress protein YaaA n=1 Tax=unclassified Herbaspirillum TaxID=2624150 RepID=UPI0015DB16AA|nr:MULTISPECIES: peroxide stress protein YaaA [unclassified Herbaspirillum]MBG7620645.1 peroxide stress protein YaaA [Herbaspirillum sp. AP02]NZD68109.1 peroxide stress protein YaaA [Herbaspirillum sp. AP21]
MLIVLSPAKSLDYDTPPTTDVYTTPAFVPRSAELIGLLKKLSPAEIGSLMGISDQLSVLNVNRYASWSRKFTTKNAKQAVLAFNGDVYEGLDAASLNGKQLDYLQNHVRILSGLYGMLRPLDLMQPYRLEMGTKLANPGGKDLYAFWGSEITEALNEELAAQKTPVLVNLASDEYFKSVKPKLLKAQVIAPVFEDWKGGKYKIISFYAKRARGLMARYAAQKNINQPEKLKAFDLEGYAFAPEASNEKNWVFRRRLEG